MRCANVLCIVKGTRVCVHSLVLRSNLYSMHLRTFFLIFIYCWHMVKRLRCANNCLHVVCVWIADCVSTFSVFASFFSFFFFLRPVPLVLLMGQKLCIKANEQCFVSVNSNRKLFFLVFSF